MEKWGAIEALSKRLASMAEEWDHLAGAKRWGDWKWMDPDDVERVERVVEIMAGAARDLDDAMSVPSSVRFARLVAEADRAEMARGDRRLMTARERNLSDRHEFETWDDPFGERW